MSRVVEVVAPTRLGQSFRWLLTASWVSNLGDGIAIAAGPLLVASETRDPFLVSLAVVLQRGPWLLFGLWAGVVADRLDRRTVMFTANAVRAAVLGMLAVTIAADRVNIAVVLGALFVLGTAEVFEDTTAQTLLPMVVAPDDLPLGNARLMAGFITVNQLVGPPLGAAMFAAGRVVPFVAHGVCMCASALAVLRLRLPPHGVAREERREVRHEIADGMRWLWGHAPMRTLAITIVTFNVTFGAAFSVLVLYAIERLHAGEVGFGLLTTAGAIGGLAGSALYGWLVARVSLGNLMRVGLILETATHAALALTTRLPIALAIMFVFGAHAFVWNTTSTTVRQRAVPTNLQGRVSSVYMIGVQGGLVVGTALGGAIADALGVIAPFWFGFGGSAVLVALLWRQLSHVVHDED